MTTITQYGADVPPSPLSLSTPHEASSKLPVLMGSNSFRDLVCDLAEVLGPYSGIDSEEIEHDELMELMRGYKSNRTDWAPYSLGDYTRGYTRNLIDKFV